MTSQALLCIPDARLRGLFSLLLTDGDVQVTTCHESEEVQRIVTTRFYDLCAITLDAAPDLTVLIKNMRQLSPDTRILLIAGKEEVERIIPLFALGVHDVLLQPINPKKAVASIQKLLYEKATTQQELLEGQPAQETAGNSGHRPQHVVARSGAMRTTLNHLWKARQEPLGILLRGEAGTEFELYAREYQAMCGDPNGFLVVLSPSEITSEGLATACSLDRLNDGIPRTFFVQDLQLLAPTQQAQLLDFLRLAKKRRDRDKPLRFVFTVADCDEHGKPVELHFVEELLYVISTVIKLPALRDRRDDIEPLARKLLLDLTAIQPEFRVRSINAAAMEWLAGRLWRGNYDEFCTYLRQAITGCTHRELTLAFMNGRGYDDPKVMAAAPIVPAAAQSKPVIPTAANLGSPPVVAPSVAPAAATPAPADPVAPAGTNQPGSFAPGALRMVRPPTQISPAGARLLAGLKI